MDNSYYKQQEDEKWKAYFYPGTETFINKFDIHDDEKLMDIEKRVVAEKIALLKDNPIEGNFDSKHLCDIHRFLFSDLYDWAGVYRNVTMTKGDYSKFTAVSDIEACLEDDLKLLKDNLRKVYNLDTFAELLADTYLGLTTVHPFREGNGRAVREFLRELVISKSVSMGLDQYTIDWDLINNDKISSYMTMGPISKTLIKLELQKGLIPNTNKSMKL